MRIGRLCRLANAAARLCVLHARVLVLVAIDAEELPVRAVGRVVVVVAVLVMDGQLAQARGGEFARAARADPGQELEGGFSVAGVGHVAIIKPKANPLLAEGSLPPLTGGRTCFRGKV